MDGISGWMDGKVDGWMDKVDGWRDKWMGGGINGRVDG